MISTFFTFLRSLLFLGEHTSKAIHKKYEESKPNIKTRLDTASENMRRKSGID